MSGLKNWMRRINYRMKRDFLTVENIVLFFAIVLCLVWTYQAIVAMSRNWELSEKLNRERAELLLARGEVQAAELQNEYYKTDEYQELLARKYADKMMPGEKMVVMPDNSEKAIQESRGGSGVVGTAGTEYSNFEKWIKFLFPVY